MSLIEVKNPHLNGADMALSTAAASRQIVQTPANIKSSFLMAAAIGDLRRLQEIPREGINPCMADVDGHVFGWAVHFANNEGKDNPTLRHFREIEDTEVYRLNGPRIFKGKTAFHLAAWRGDALALSILLNWNEEKFPSKASANLLDAEMRSPLHEAALCEYPGSPECMRLLLSKGANPNAESKVRQIRPLHIVTDARNTGDPNKRKWALEGIKLLLRWNADPKASQKDNINWPPLFRLIRGKDVEGVRVFLQGVKDKKESFIGILNRLKNFQNLPFELQDQIAENATNSSHSLVSAKFDKAGRPSPATPAGMAVEINNPPILDAKGNLVLDESKATIKTSSTITDEMLAILMEHDPDINPVITPLDDPEKKFSLAEFYFSKHGDTPMYQQLKKRKCEQDPDGEMDRPAKRQRRGSSSATSNDMDTT